MIFKRNYFKKLSRRTQPPFLRAVLLFCSLILTCLWFSTVVVAAGDSRIELSAEEQAWLVAHPEIVLGATSEYPPLVIRGPDGTHTGVMVDLYAEVNRLLGTKIRLHIEDPWTEVQDKAQNREIDGLVLGGRSASREALYLATDTLFPTYFSVFASNQGEDHIKSFSDLDGMRIGYKLGAGATKHLLGKLPSAILTTYPSHETLTQAQLSNEVDVIVAWISYDHWRKGKMQGTIDNIFLIDEYPIEMVTHVRKDWPELVSILNKAIAALQKDALPRIVNKWFGQWPQQTKAAGLQLTSEERAWLKAHPRITLASSDGNYPPHVIKNPGGTWTGFNVDFFELVSQLLDSEVRLHHGTWSEVQEKAKNLELDGLTIVGRDPNRDVIFNASDVIYPSYFSVFAPNGNNLTIDSFKDLDGLRIGFKRGARPAKTRLEKLSSATLVPFDSHETMTQALLSREINVIVAWVGYDNWRKNTLQGTIDKIYLIEEYPLDMVVYFRKDWPEFVPIMNKAIAVLQREALPKTINKWFGDRPKSQVETKVLLTLEEQAWLKQQSTVRVRIVDWPPYLIVKVNEPPQGIVIDYLKLIEKRTGVRFKYEVTDQPFAEFLESMKQNQGPDMTAVITPTPEREEYLSFSEAYISSPYVIFIREQEAPILDINGLAGKTVAIPRGFVLQQELANGYPEIRQLLVDSDAMALQAVATGRADAYIGNLTVASHIIHKRGFSNLQVTSPSPFGEQALSMGSRKDWPEITSILDKALLSITEEEKTDILSKYLAIKYERGINKAEILKWVFVTGFVLLSIIALFIFWNKQLSRKVRERTAELSDSETRFRAIFEQAAVGIAHVSPEGQFIRLNQKLCDILGYSQDEMLNMTFNDITHPDDLDTNRKLVQQLLDGVQDSYTLEKRDIRKDSSVVWINLTVRIVRSDDGTPRWFVSVVEDISARINAQDKVQKSYDFLRHLTTTVPDALFSVKIPERTVLWCNDYYGVLGYDSLDCVGETTDMFYPGPEEAKKIGDLLESAIISGDDLIRTEVMLQRKNGEVFPAEINIAILREAGVVASVTALARDISERKEAELKALEHQKRLKQLTSQLTLAEEQERRLIAAELHDEVGQALAFSQMQLAAVIREQDDAKIKEQLEQISETLLKTTRETRNLIFELSSPTMHELGLSTAISEWFEEKLHNSHGIKLSLFDMLVGDELDEEQYTILFRNIRELLTNVIKHARANEVQVSLEHVDDDVRITVKDNGIGFDPEQVAKQANEEGGFGIFSIGERMADLGGKLEIKASPHQGCSMIMTIPIDQQNGRPV